LACSAFFYFANISAFISAIFFAISSSCFFYSSSFLATNSLYSAASFY